MKQRSWVFAIVASAVFYVGVTAQEAGRGMAPPAAPKEITKIKVERKPVQTIKKEVPIPQPVHKDTPEFRGEGFYFQRCSTCHLGEYRKAGPIEPYGPALKGVLKDPARETAVRGIVKNGTRNMPGFEHTFTESQFDDLIAYLKTL